mmetsp:Transcript_2507/g.8019  ORF Transcript_2507/g.8019 Transcript_2507/m.8019 type:complete len:233 (+) Transcript_2507:822-1520(+)
MPAVIVPPSSIPRRRPWDQQAKLRRANRLQASQRSIVLRHRLEQLRQGSLPQPRAAEFVPLRDEPEHARLPRPHIPRGRRLAAFRRLSRTRRARLLRAFHRLQSRSKPLRAVRAHRDGGVAQDVPETVQAVEDDDRDRQRGLFLRVRRRYSRRVLLPLGAFPVKLQDVIDLRVIELHEHRVLRRRRRRGLGRSSFRQPNLDALEDVQAHVAAVHSGRRARVSLHAVDAEHGL